MKMVSFIISVLVLTGSGTSHAAECQPPPVPSGVSFQILNEDCSEATKNGNTFILSFGGKYFISIPLSEPIGNKINYGVAFNNSQNGWWDLGNSFANINTYHRIQTRLLHWPTSDQNGLKVPSNTYKVYLTISGAHGNRNVYVNARVNETLPSPTPSPTVSPVPSADRVWKYVDPNSAGQAWFAQTDSEGNLYTAGFDNSHGSNQWRVQKNSSVGVLLWNYTPAPGSNNVTAMAYDPNGFLFVGGWEQGETPGARIEKISTTNGAIIWSYSTPFAPTAIAADPTGYIYIAYKDTTVPVGDPLPLPDRHLSSQWRVDKVNTAPDPLPAEISRIQWTYTSNPSPYRNYTTGEQVNALVYDPHGDFLYVTGVEALGPEIADVANSTFVSNGSQWRVEKLRGTNAPLPNASRQVWFYNTAPTSGSACCSSPATTGGAAMDPDGEFLYVSGNDAGGQFEGRFAGRWRLEKIRTSSPSKVWEITSTPAPLSNKAESVTYDPIEGAIYMGGMENGGDPSKNPDIVQPGHARIRVEKISRDGQRIWNYTHNVSPGPDEGFQVAVSPEGAAYIAGYDSAGTVINGHGTSRFRIEKIALSSLPPLSISANVTSRNVRKGESLPITIQVKSNSVGVAGAKLSFLVTKPGGSTKYISAQQLTQSNGNSLWNFIPEESDPVGLYSIRVFVQSGVRQNDAVLENIRVLGPPPPPIQILRNDGTPADMDGNILVLKRGVEYHPLITVIPNGGNQSNIICQNYLQDSNQQYWNTGRKESGTLDSNGQFSCAVLRWGGQSPITSGINIPVGNYTTLFNFSGAVGPANTTLNVRIVP